MEDVFARIVLGHLTGDYLLQNRTMALQKSQKNWMGFFWCTWHCVLYTASICLFLWTANPVIIGLVFLSHWPIDRYSLANYWFKFVSRPNIMETFSSQDKYRDIELPFACLIYVITDNTMHLILLWLITKVM